MTSYDPFRPKGRRPAPVRQEPKLQAIPPSAGPPPAQPAPAEPEQPQHEHTEQVERPEEPAGVPPVPDSAPEPGTVPEAQPPEQQAQPAQTREQRLAALSREDLVALAQLHGVATRHVNSRWIVEKLDEAGVDPAEL